MQKYKLCLSLVYVSICTQKTVSLNQTNISSIYIGPNKKTCLNQTTLNLFKQILFNPNK